jgi:hypothetical protein
MKKLYWSSFFFIFLFQPLAAQLSLSDIQNLSNEYGPSREPALTNVGDNYYLVWNQWGDIMFRKSTNNGINWGNKLTLYSSFDYGANYPVIAAADGKVYIAYYRNTPGNSEIFMVKSSNDGQSFGNEMQVTNSINLAQVPQIAASGDTVVIAYEDRDVSWNYQIFLIKSIDGGQTWSAPQNLSNSSNNARWCNLQLRNNELFVLWNDQTGANYDDLDVFFTKSDNFGANWSLPQNITNNAAYNARLNTRLLDNSIYVAVSAKVDGLQSDILLYRSTDLGNTWESPVNLSDNSGNSSRPHLWVTPNYMDNHRIYAIWSDETYHANERVYLRYSNDNGFSWSDMTELSQPTEDAFWPQLAGNPGSTSDQLYMAWVRPHDGTFNYEVWGRRGENQLAQAVTLSGTVSDAAGESVADATVALNGYVVFSMPDGQYNLEVPAGVYDFSVSAAGYQNYSVAGMEVLQDMEVDVTLETLVPGHYPPHLLQAEVVDVENIFARWDTPIGFGSIELGYDDGESNGLFWVGSATGNEMMAVAFEHDEAFYLRQLKLFASPGEAGEQMLVHVLADNNGMPDISTSYGGPYLVEVESGWVKIPVDIPMPANVRFYIACQWNTGNTYRIGGDLNQATGFSYSTSNNGAQWFVHDDMDFMIRAGIAFDSRSEHIDLNPSQRDTDLLGYHVFLNGTQQDELIEENYFMLTEVAVGQLHTLEVTAVYEGGESSAASVQLFVPEPLLFPPLNLMGEVVDATVLLHWDAPASEGEWLHWDDGVNADVVGGSNIEIFDAAVRFTTTDLEAYDGQYLTQLAAFIADADVQVFMRVWQGGNQNYAGNLVREQLMAYPIADSWNTIELDEPVMIDATQELWFGYRVINTNGVYPAGTDNGPALPFKGDMLLYGSNWVSMQNEFGWNINWNIQGMVVDAGENKQSNLISLPLNNQPITGNGTPELVAAGRNKQAFSWTYGHFNVYRNQEIIGTSPAGTYTFLDEYPQPLNTYYVSTAWGSFESLPSNEVVIDLVGLSEKENNGLDVQLWPNPARGQAELVFELDSPQLVNLQLAGLAGQSVTILHQQYLAEGMHRIKLDADRLKPFAAGKVVVIKLVTAEKTTIRRLVLIE